MRLLFMMAQPYVPSGISGMQPMSRALARALAERGHATAIAAETGQSGLRATAALLRAGGRLFRTEDGGVLLFRVRSLAAKAGRILSAFRPDCVILHATGAMQVAGIVNDRAIPLVVAWQDADVQRLGAPPTALTARFVANSRFTAETYRAAFGIESTVIPPLIPAELHATPGAGRSHVTFVNPTAEKGLDLALAIAENCPDIRFEFVETRRLDQAARQALLGRLKTRPNVAFTPHQPDMRQVYARSCILLAPYQGQEPWSRAAAEAQLSGIPVIGTKTGGIEESVGPGGILLPPGALPQDWVAALRALWDNAERYADLSAQARRYAQRPELDVDWTVNAMLAEIEAAIALRRSKGAVLF